MVAGLVQRLIFFALIVWLTLGLWYDSAQSASLGNGIIAPTANMTVQGVVPVEGIAQHPGFRKWQLDLLIHGSGHGTFVAGGEKTLPEAGLLTHLDTTRYPDGQHLLRLRVVYTGLNYDEYFLPITINNQLRMAIATPTLAEWEVQEEETLATPEPTPTAGLAEAHPQNNPELVAQVGGGKHKLPYQVELLPALGQGVPDGKRWIEVDLSEQTLTAWQGEVVVLKTQVSTGRPGLATIRGAFAVAHKYDRERMTGPGYDTPDVPWTMYFKWGFAIHGAYWHNNFGTPVSHGCVNMRLHEAKVLYEWAEVGTEVVVHE